MAHNLPVIDVRVRGQRVVKALVDTGCTKTVVSSHLVGKCEGEVYVIAFDGSRVKCRGRREVTLNVCGTEMIVDTIITDRIFGGVEMVLGMDVINRMGGVAIVNGKAEFSGVCCGVKTQMLESDENGVDENMSSGIEDDCKIIGRQEIIKDSDFEASFDGENWTASWVWKGDIPMLKNKVDCYDKNMSEDIRDGFEKEVERWIEEGILMPWEEKVHVGIIPLMAVYQPTKKKVRPVLDFRELNKYVNCHTGDDVIDVCTETLREWRQETGAATIVDLKAAYLQIRISKELWRYQLVNYKGKTFCLTRLGFGLNCAPRIMSKVLKHVLSKSNIVKSATKSYIDDILVNENIVTADAVIKHLNEYGLVTKNAEPLEGGAALGLSLKSNRCGELMFSRSNDIPSPDDITHLTKRELFSICGKLVGHYPIVGWLRVSCSFIKRRSGDINWEDGVSENVCTMVREVLRRVKSDDPVKGVWYVPRTCKGVVWCDASSIALGVALQIDNIIAEDAAWLRKSSDFNHINVAELEAVMKGVNLALRWGLTSIEIMTDSATVNGWIKTVLSEERRVQSKGASELLVKRRLGILKSLIEEFHLQVNITLVPTSKNLADVLTRVKKEWLTKSEVDEVYAACAVGHIDLRALHDRHHMGVDRTLFLARKIFPGTSRDAVKKVVQSCERCQSIDPAPVTHKGGGLSVSEVWNRLAIDVTHHHQIPYLSIVDCGPGRFAIWRKLTRETTEFITGILDEIFLERGPVREVLMDNGMAFRSELMMLFFRKWNVRPLYRAAYRPSGNGIVERHHRTVKAIAERGNISPQEAVYWYNSSPRSGLDAESVPHTAIYKYKWGGSTDLNEDAKKEDVRFDVGDEVWVKPPNARCVTQWKRGVVTGINSSNNIEVDGMPRHVLDVRKFVRLELESDNDHTEDEVEEEIVGETELKLELVAEELEGRPEEDDRRYPERERRPPAWLADYET